MLRSRLQRTALVATGAILATVAASMLGRTPEPGAPIEMPVRTADPEPIAADLRRCAPLDGDRIDDAGCMAVWEENRRRFFGGQARPHASVAAPVLKPAPGEPADAPFTPPEDLFPAPDARSREPAR